MEKPIGTSLPGDGGHTVTVMDRARVCCACGFDELLRLGLADAFDFAEVLFGRVRHRFHGVLARIFEFLDVASGYPGSLRQRVASPTLPSKSTPRQAVTRAEGVGEPPPADR